MNPNRPKVPAEPELTAKVGPPEPEAKGDARGILEWLMRPSLRRPSGASSQDRAFRTKAFAWGAFPGVFIGALIMGRFGLIQGVLVMVGITAFVGGSALMIAEMISGSVRGATNPRAARPRPSHSRAEALLVRGEHQAALDFLEASLAEFPDDAEAFIRIARIHRDALHDRDAALRWFRKGRTTGCFTDAQMRVTMREMRDLARSHPSEAAIDLVTIAPDLAQHRDHFAGTDEADWASRELAEAKKGMSGQG